MTDAHTWHPEDGVGYLTWEQFERFRRATENARVLVPWLRVAGYITSAAADVRVHTSRDGHIGLPPTWLAAEEITRLLNELNQWPELEDAAADDYGAWVAWEFTRETETAAARWPHTDRPHRVRVMRCAACDALTLRYHPPRHDGDRIVVRCSDKACGAFMDEDMFAFAAHMIETENREQKRLADDRRRRAGRGQVTEDDLQVGT